jgi:hypothetical protein
VLGDDPQRLPGPDHARDLGFARLRVPPHGLDGRARLQPERRRVSEDTRAERPDIEAERVAEVFEGERPLPVLVLDPGARGGGELGSFALRPDLTRKALDRVLEHGPHESPLADRHRVSGQTEVGCRRYRSHHLGSTPFLGRPGRHTAGETDHPKA